MTKTFAERCQLAQQSLPDAQYRAMLTALHAEMLDEVERLNKAVADEREACAKEAESWDCHLAAAEIRLRGNT